jgi:hypothetical protein
MRVYVVWTIFEGHNLKTLRGTPLRVSQALTG